MSFQIMKNISKTTLSRNPQVKVPQPFANFLVEDDTLIVLVLWPQLLSQKRLGLTSQSSLTTKDPKRFEYLKLLHFLLYGSKKEKWFLDSGCSRHMTGDKSKFVFLARRKRGYVTFEDNKKCRIIGHGYIGNNSSSLIDFLSTIVDYD